MDMCRKGTFPIEYIKPGLRLWSKCYGREGRMRTERETPVLNRINTTGFECDSWSSRDCNWKSSIMSAIPGLFWIAVTEEAVDQALSESRERRRFRQWMAPRTVFVYFATRALFERKRNIWWWSSFITWRILGEERSKLNDGPGTR